MATMTILGTRDSALDQDEVLLGIDADNGKVLDGNALVTHVTGQS